MVRYLVSEFRPGIRIVTVTGRTDSGTFADGVVAIVSKNAGQWQGRAYADLKPGWYNAGGEYLRPAGKLEVAP